MKKVLGIDCGFCGMGYAVVDISMGVVGCLVASGAYRTEKANKKRKLRVSEDDIQRVQFLVRSLNTIIDEHKPLAIFVEIPSAGAKGAKANRAMGLSTGLLAALLEFKQVPVSYLLPTDVRKILCGKASAGKEDAAKIARACWPQGPWPEVKEELEHALDAAAVIMASRDDQLYRMAMR